jgi:DNA-binding transcriptional ArsR family regulator
MNGHEQIVDRLVQVFRALGDPVRLRLIGLIAERPRSGKELAEAVTVGAPTVSHHMDKLVRAGLVSVRRHGQSRTYSLNQETLKTFAQLARGGLAKLDPGELPNDDERERAKVLRDFFDGDRLQQIPAQRKKRVIVLQHLVARFEPERDYTEREVSDLLKQAHKDFATLRRELIDYGFMTRAGGVYRVARDLPQRSTQVGQEITGDESAWLRRLLSSTAAPLQDR